MEKSGSSGRSKEVKQVRQVFDARATYKRRHADRSLKRSRVWCHRQAGSVPSLSDVSTCWLNAICRWIKQTKKKEKLKEGNVSRTIRINNVRRNNYLWNYWKGHRWEKRNEYVYLKQINIFYSIILFKFLFFRRK